MLIAIEGIDSAGKTTQIQLLKQYLKKQNKTVLSFHFPNRRSIFGKELYDYYSGNKYYSKECHDLLHTLDKMCMQDQIISWMSSYDYVILDRYKLSQIAYSDDEWNNVLVSKAINPDIGIILDIPAKMAAERKEEKDRYEKDIYFQEKVRTKFISIGKKNGYVIVDATKNIWKINKKIIKTIEERNVS